MAVGCRSSLLALLGFITATELAFTPCAASEDVSGSMDIDEVEEKAEQLGAKGDPAGYAHLGVAFLTGHGAPQNEVKAVEYMTKAADLDDADSQYNLGILYMGSEALNRDPKKAEELWKKAARAGHQLSQFNLGLMYHGGDGVEKSYSKAMKYWKMASKEGNAMASENVAVMFEEGHGVKKNTTKAIQFWKVALDQNSTKAKTKLAFYNFAGDESGEKNKTRAVQLLEAAGDGTSLYNAALMYLDGDGVPKNETKAEQLLYKAMNMKNWNATVALGQLWYDGHGTIAKNVSLARAAWRVVSEKAPDSDPAKKTAKKLFDEAMNVAATEMMDSEEGPWGMLQKRFNLEL